MIKRLTCFALQPFILSERKYWRWFYSFPILNSPKIEPSPFIMNSPKIEPPPFIEEVCHEHQ